MLAGKVGFSFYSFLFVTLLIALAEKKSDTISAFDYVKVFLFLKVLSAFFGL